MQKPGVIFERLLSLGRPLANALAHQRYQRRLRRGQAAGEYRYQFGPCPPLSPLVEVFLPATVSQEQAIAWCTRQTLPEIAACGHASDGKQLWRYVAPGAAELPAPAGWFAAPGVLPDSYPSHLESCLLVAAAEDVDAVVLRERIPGSAEGTVQAADILDSPGLRPYCLFKTGSYRYDAATDSVMACGERQLVKLIGTQVDLPSDSDHFGPLRRGPYLSGVPLGPRLDLGVRDAARLGRQGNQTARPGLLVLTCFLARGGAEQTLFDTLMVLKERFELAIVTLAPHRSNLGDRRQDFAQITDRIYCFGDLVHPAVMYGMLCALLDSLATQIIYNANGTTIFYELAPRLKAERSELRIIDHLYDHRVGYIDRYERKLLAAVDACVAENRRIAQVLVAERGWPAQRVPVIWPCGRPPGVFPAPSERAAVRGTLRRELAIAEHDLVFLTAARMHPQKRPLDLVALAERVSDLGKVQFLVVGGGDLAADLDAAIAAAPGARIRRLDFRTDIPNLIVAADIGCLVSEYEGLPVFMLECLQMGRPFLATAVGDMGEVLRKTGAGLLVETPGDMEALEAAVRRFTDADERARCGERALAAAPDFDVASCAEAYADVFLGQNR